MSYEDRGTVYLRQDQPEQAMKMFNQALAIDPQMLNSLVGLAKCYLLKGQVSPAFSYLRKALKLEPASVETHYLPGQTLLKSGNTEEGREELRKASQLELAMNRHHRENENNPILDKLPTISWSLAQSKTSMQSNR